MQASRYWGRAIFQLCAVALVAWGIYHSMSQSSIQLANQRQDLTQRANALLEQAERATAPLEKERLQQEASQLQAASNDFWKARPLGLILAGAVYALGMLPASLFWRRCLAAFEQPTHLLATLWAYFYGNLGKYFPGKAMVIVLRLAALEKYGIQKTATSITIFMETLTMMSVGGAVAAVCLIILGIDWRLTLLAVGLLLTTFFPTYPPLLRILLSKLQRGVAPQTLSEWANRIHWRLLARGWLAFAVTWSAFGLSLFLVLCSLPGTNMGTATLQETLLSSMGACAFAVVLGFVSLIPGGAGVREVVLSTVLTPVVGPTAALSSAVWLRIVWLCTELCVVGLLALLRTFTKENVAAHSV